MRSDSKEYVDAIIAFERRKKRAWLWKYCRRWKLLEDLEQESYAALFELTKKSLRIRNLNALVRRVCARCASTAIQKLRERAIVEHRASLQAKANVSSPEHRAKLLQGIAWVLNGAAQLPPSQRYVFLKCAVEGCFVEDVAKDRGCAIATVRRTLYNARQSLRKKIRESSLDGEERSVLSHFGLED